jgi:hypothetical protein
MGDIRRSVGLCAVALAIFAVAPACGGDDDSPNGIDTGLAADRKLSSLSDGDVQNACRSINQGAAVAITPAELVRAACLPAGVQAGLTISGSDVSIDVTKCQKAVDACVAEDEDETEADVDYMNDDDCDEASAEDLQGCDATVGELETCFNIMLNQTQQQLSAATCQNAENLDEQGYANELDPENIPECMSLRTKCPDAQLGIPFRD